MIRYLNVHSLRDCGTILLLFLRRNWKKQEYLEKAEKFLDDMIQEHERGWFKKRLDYELKQEILQDEEN